jgi:hypothetical protein
MNRMLSCDWLTAPCADQLQDDDGILRFHNVPNSLQYTLILLTGDYPLVDFTLSGKVRRSVNIQ